MFFKRSRISRGKLSSICASNSMILCADVGRVKPPEVALNARVFFILFDMKPTSSLGCREVVRFSRVAKRSSSPSQHLGKACSAPSSGGGMPGDWSVNVTC